MTTELRSQLVAAAQLSSVKGLKEDFAQPSEISSEELISFDRSYKRSLRAASQTGDHVLAGIFARHKLDIMLALLISRRQVGGIFGGTSGDGGIGVSYNWEPAFWGIGADDWRGQTPTTAGSLQNMIDAASGTQSATLSGAAGDDVQFGKNVVFCVLGYANYSQDYPRITKIQERVDTALQPVLLTGSVWKNEHADHPVKIFEKDSALYLKDQSKFRLQVLAEATVPASEWIWPVGAMFTRTNLLLEGDMGSKDETFLKDREIIVKT